MNHLYFGDNLEVLRQSIKDESVDLVYLDPPFNSKANYNVLFKSPQGQQSGSQITAFEDTWHWGEQAEKEFTELVTQPNGQVVEVVRALRQFLGENDMMAYLTMMANRMLELHRVLKPTGSLYLHCDPTASHYLKVVLDAVFGVEQYTNEIVWKRSDAHNDAGRYGRVHDVILFYKKGRQPTFNTQYTPLPQSTVDNWYRNVEEGTGRRFNKADVTAPGGRGPLYKWNGVERNWRYRKEKMEELDKAGRLIYSKSGMPYEKRYLDESRGVAVQDLWDDIQMLRGISAGGERLGYPTQKPVALLERIIKASTNEREIVLDPFCGCGTAVHAAEKLGRPWIGIDVTHLAISLVEKRLHDAFPAVKYKVHGTPKDVDGAMDLAQRDKYEFQYWACSLVGAQPYQNRKKGADGGVDGLIFFEDEPGKPKKIVVSVKGGANVDVKMIRELEAVMRRQKADIALFVTLTDPTKPMKTEAASAGYYTSPINDQKYPRIQILTIEDLLAKKAEPRYPRISSGLTFKQSKVEQGEDTQRDFFN